jgi:hypothetical protein
VLPGADGNPLPQLQLEAPPGGRLGLTYELVPPQSGRQTPERGAWLGLPRSIGAGARAWLGHDFNANYTGIPGNERAELLVFAAAMCIVIALVNLLIAAAERGATPFVLACAVLSLARPGLLWPGISFALLTLPLLLLPQRKAALVPASMWVALFHVWPFFDGLYTELLTQTARSVGLELSWMI